MRQRLSNGEKAKIKLQSLDGMWFPCQNKAIVRRCLRGRRFMNTMIHELIHAECDELKEKKVRRIARTVARTLWKAFGKKKWSKRLGVKRV